MCIAILGRTGSLVLQVCGGRMALLRHERVRMAVCTLEFLVEGQLSGERDGRNTVRHCRGRCGHFQRVSVCTCHSRHLQRLLTVTALSPSQAHSLPVSAAPLYDTALPSLRRRELCRLSTVISRALEVRLQTLCRIRSTAEPASPLSKIVMQIASMMLAARGG